MHVQASTNYGKPSASTSIARGGLWRCGHDDGVGGGAPASLRAALELTELYQRALGESVGCWGGSGAVVVMEKLGASWCLQRRWRTLGAGTATTAGAANGEGGAGKCEMMRWAGAGGAGGDNGLLWLGAA